MAEMTEAQFVELVKKAEHEADTNIQSYKLKLALFALLGYVVIFSILFFLVLLVGGTVATAFISSTLFLLLLKKKLIFILLPAIWIMLKALWVKFEKPTGYRLDQKNFPEIWKQVDDLSRQLKSKPVHQIILSPELNASISQTPRLGVLGWQFNTLTLGMELMLIASPDEIRSVIAHELGHLSGNHSKFSGWIYRVRMSWQQLMDAFQNSEGMGAKMMRRFFDWYAPKFAAYSFALARNNEYEADAISAQLTSPAIATSALVNVYATSPFIDEKYWKMFYLKADSQPEPEHAPFEGLVKFVSNNSLTTEEKIENIKSAMQVNTEYDDTHPCLKDRVDAIGAEPVLPKTVEKSAAHAWLGDKFETVLGDFDQQWLEHNRDAWRERYDYVTDSKAKLEELSGKNRPDLAEDELWQLAMLKIEFETDDGALEVLQDYKARFPDDLDADFVMGQIYYRKDDEQCLEYFARAREKEALKIDACEYAYYYLVNHEREEEAGSWYEIADQQIQLNQAAQAERSEATVNDEYQPVDLSSLSDDMQQVLQHIAGQKKVKKAWIASKVVHYYPENPVYIIAFTAKGFYFSYEGVQKQVTDSIVTNEEVFVVVKGDEFKKLAKKVIKNGIQFKD